MGPVRGRPAESLGRNRQWKWQLEFTLAAFANEKWQLGFTLVALTNLGRPEVPVLPAHPRALLRARPGAAGRRQPGALPGAGARGVRRSALWRWIRLLRWGGVPRLPRIVCTADFGSCSWRNLDSVRGWEREQSSPSRNLLVPGFGGPAATPSAGVEHAVRVAPFARRVPLFC